jgi:hypothetical protein
MQCPNESENFGCDRRPAARLNIESDANSEPGLCAAWQNGGARKSTAVNKSDKMQAGKSPIVAARLLRWNSAAACLPDISVLSRIGFKRIASALRRYGRTPMD